MNKRIGWLRALGLSFAAALASVPLTLALAFTVVAFTLCLVFVGFWLVPTAFRLNRFAANMYRSLAAAVLRHPVEHRYRELTAKPGIARAQQCFADEQRWRDVGWNVIFHAALWVLPTVAAGGITVGICAWPIWVNARGGSHLVGILLMLVCWAIWAALVVPATYAWALLAAIVLGDKQAELQRKLAAERAQRAEQLDHSAAEMLRIERDLHDGAQARIAALGMTLGLAADLIDRDPVQARALIEEASASSSHALEDIRAVVRGMHPPVLADRGLVGAVNALAIDLPIRVEVESRLETRLPVPVESAIYFAVAELLANAVKHSGARNAWVTLAHHNSVAVAVVGDDGHGGARVTPGGGLGGVARRVAAFDGTLGVNSPPGGPTTIRLELPCASSSPKTMHSYETASFES